MEKTFEERVSSAAERYLTGRGYEILDRVSESAGSAPAVFVAVDDGEYVFVKLMGSETGEFPDETMEDRDAMEKLAITWLAEHDNALGDGAQVRFDIISIAVVPKGNRALLRHHKYAFNAL